jgi:hypothetical protein
MQRPNQVDPRHDRHIMIGNEQISAMSAISIQRQGAVHHGRDSHSRVGSYDNTREQGANIVVILRDQDVW